MSPKFVNKIQKKKEIAQAALDLFGKRGFFATSVEQIADAVGIGKGTVYEYFKTKEEIFTAAVLLWSEHSEIKFQEVLKAIEDPVEQLHLFVSAFMNVFDPNQPSKSRVFIDIFQQTFSENGALRTKHYLLKEITVKRFQVVIQILLNGISRGVFKPEIAKDVEAIAINLIFFLRGIGLHSLLTEKMFDINAQVDMYMQTLLEKILFRHNLTLSEI